MWTTLVVPTAILKYRSRCVSVTASLISTTFGLHIDFGHTRITAFTGAKSHAFCNIEDGGDFRKMSHADAEWHADQLKIRKSNSK